jgi:hypothetical protein
MRSILPAILALTAQVSASHFERSSDITLNDGVILEGEEFLIAGSDIDEISAMEFVGPVTPGGPDITLSGSVKDIYEQIIELNPSYDVFDFPEYADALESEGLNRENIETANLTTRNPSRDAEDTLAKRGDGINCSVGKYVGNIYTQCSEGIYYLRKLGRARCSAKPRSCARVSCSRNCGMYYCSKFNKTVKAYCQDIARDIEAIAAKCGLDYGDYVRSARGRKGFRDHNVELSRASC